MPAGSLAHRLGHLLPNTSRGHVRYLRKLQLPDDHLQRRAGKTDVIGVGRSEIIGLRLRYRTLSALVEVFLKHIPRRGGRQP